MNHPLKRRFLWRLFVFASLLAGAVVAFLYRHEIVQPKTLSETPRERLVLRAGRLYLDGGETPFAGWMIERYATGKLKSRSTVSNGMLEGLSLGWHTNGVRQVEEWFHTNVSHGVRYKWHENGQKLSEASIVAGKIEGVFRRWHENGRLAEEITMKAGQPDGVSRAYFPSGCLKAEVRLREGKVTEQHFWKDGERQPPALPRADNLAARTN